MPKISVNLSIEITTLERARRYGERHDVSISRLVGDFLDRLPLAEDDDVSGLPPITRRLFGIAVGGPDEEDYRSYLLEKYSR